LVPKNRVASTNRPLPPSNTVARLKPELCMVLADAGGDGIHSGGFGPVEQPVSSTTNLRALPPVAP
jgi:hypothetical protein